MSATAETSVYFIKVGKYLKVGLSADPERRCHNLFRSSTSGAAPWDCPKSRADRTLLGSVPGDLHDERDAHKALRLFGVGCEFFLAEQPALDYVSLCLAEGGVVAQPVPRAAGHAERANQIEPPLSPEETAAVFARARQRISAMTSGGAA